MVATVTLFRQGPRLAERLPAAIAISAGLAGASSVLLWLGVAPATVVARYARIGYRVSAHVADLNAAGSYFAMALCLALGMAIRARRQARAWWLVAVLATAIGLWFAGSRTATAAFAVTAATAIAWVGTSRLQPKTRVVAFVTLAALALALGSFRARGLERDPTYRGAGFRTQFNESSLRMLAARPLFGVGVGQYYRTSPLFLTPELAWTYGNENAHNYFLQVGAELGLIGLALFAAWAGVGLWRAIRALAHQPRDARLLGATAGIVALLGTCLTGHPLLVAEVAFPFWIQFGLVAGLAGSVLLNAESREIRPARRGPRPWRLAAAAMVVGADLRARQRRTATNRAGHVTGGRWILWMGNRQGRPAVPLDGTLREPVRAGRCEAREHSGPRADQCARHRSDRCGGDGRRQRPRTHARGRFLGDDQCRPAKHRSPGSLQTHRLQDHSHLAACVV